MKKFILFSFILSSLIAGQSEAASTPQVWWVDLKNGNDNSAGSTEVTAFKTVHKALESNSWNSGDTIKVKPSINPDGSFGYYDFGDKEININTTKDFVLMGTKGADSTIFNAEGKSRHFNISGTLSRSTQIRGITFYNGDRSSNGSSGGSIELSGGNVKLQFVECVFDSNRVDFSSDYNSGANGGAITIYYSKPIFIGCTFKNNYVIGRDTHGGAIYIDNANSVSDMQDTIIFKKTKFIKNYAKANNSVYGGAVYARVNTYFENCLFLDNGIDGSNNSNNNGYDTHGGAIFSNPKYSTTGGKVIIVNSTFDGNYAIAKSTNAWPDGAVLSYGIWDEQVTRKAYVFNTIITNSIIKRNGVDLRNVRDNGKYDIFWAQDNNKLTVDYSNIEGSTNQPWADDNVFDVNPAYNDTAKLDYSLSDKSPLIGKGISNWSDEGLNAPTEDMLGNTRPNPSGSNPDMGAYENSKSASTAPMPVSGLTIQSATASAILSWSKNKVSLGSSTDADNIQYQIYQNGTNVAQTTTTTYTVTGLTNGTTYSFTVSAKNTSTGIEGAQSGAKTVKPIYSGPKWYVAASGGKSSGTDDDDLGSSTVPLNHISSALELAATGDTIVMMKGTHSGSNNRGINEDGNKSFVIIGDPDYSADQTIIDAGARDRHFTFDNNEDTTFQIIGLTLYNGKTTSRGGGSIKIENGGVKIKNVIFKENYSTGEDWSTSGAIWMERSGKTIIDGCSFDGNYIYNTEAGNIGGAIFASHQNNKSDTLKIINSIFKNNYVKTKHGAKGGAIGIYHYQAVIENNLFYDNYVQSAVGENVNNQNASAGAVYIYNPNYWDSNSQSTKALLVLLRNNTIVNNYVKSDDSQSWLEGAGVEFHGGDPGLIISFNNIVWGNKLVGRENNRQVYFDTWNDDLKIYEDYNW